MVATVSFEKENMVPFVFMCVCSVYLSSICIGVVAVLTQVAMRLDPIAIKTHTQSSLNVRQNAHVLISYSCYSEMECPSRPPLYPD